MRSPRPSVSACVAPFGARSEFPDSLSRDCLETPDRIHLVVPRACATRVKVSFSAPRATDKRAIQPVQLLFRQSLEKLFGNSEWVTNRGCESGQDGPKESLSASPYR